MKPRSYYTPPLLFVLAFSTILQAGTITLDFEGLPDSTSLTTQYAGLTFSNTQILAAGIGLNEFEFPPHSGMNIASDNSGPISIFFSSPVLSFAGFFTHTVPLTLRAYNGASAQVAMANSLFSNNLACLTGPPCPGNPGSTPNELLQISFASGISRLTIAGDPAGGSFALDDSTITSLTTPTSGVPEPGALTMVAIGSCMISVRRYKNNVRRSKL